MKNIQVHPAIFACPEFNKAHLFIICTALYHNHTTNTPFTMSRKDMAKLSGVSLNTIGRTIKHLKSVGIIEPEHDSKRIGEILNIVIDTKAISDFLKLSASK